jgi:hypothetical protein
MDLDAVPTSERFTKRKPECMVMKLLEALLEKNPTKDYS